MSNNNFLKSTKGIQHKRELTQKMAVIAKTDWFSSLLKTTTTSDLQEKYPSLWKLKNCLFPYTIIPRDVTNSIISKEEIGISVLEDLQFLTQEVPA